MEVAATDAEPAAGNVATCHTAKKLSRMSNDTKAALKVIWVELRFMLQPILWMAKPLR